MHHSTIGSREIKKIEGARNLTVAVVNAGRDLPHGLDMDVIKVDGRHKSRWT